MIQRALPARHTHAPFVARFQSGEAEFRMRRNEIVAVEYGIIQKFLCDFNANGMQPNVFRSCSTKTVAVKSGERVATTTFQLGPKNIRRHKQVSVESSLTVMLSEAKHLGFISSALIQERSEILRSAQNDIGR